MSRRPAAFTQADITRAIGAAKKSGVAEVEIKLPGEASIVIRIRPSTSDEPALAQSNGIVL
jgi:hypothetical protein